MSCDFFPHTKTPIKNPKKISILKDLSSLHYSPAVQKKKKKSPEFCNVFPPCQKSAIYIEKNIFLNLSRGFWECEQMSHSESRGG